MRILLVDDDIGVLQALLAILKTLPGHEVRIAGTGGEALKAAMEMSGVDLLITDVVMEPMDGFTLRDHLVSRYPDTRTILISGYDLSDYPEQTQNHRLLAKPIDAETLLAAIAQEFPAAPAPEPEAVPVPAPASAAAQAPAPEEPAAAPEPVAVEAPAPEEPVAAPEPAAVEAPAPEEPAAAPEPIAVEAPAPEEPVAAPEPVAAEAPAPEEPAAAPKPIATPAPAVAAPVAARPSTPAPVQPPPVAVPRPAAPPAVRATPGPAPSAPSAPVARPAAVPVARPTVVAKAIPAPVAPSQPVPKAQPTVRATAVPAPSAPQPTLKAQAAPPSGVRAIPAPPPKAAPVAKPAMPKVAPATPPAVPQSAPAAQPAAPKAVPAAPPAVTVKAAAVPRPSIVVPVPTPAPVAKPAAAPPPAARPAAATPAPGQPTIRMAATVRAQPVPPPSAPGQPAAPTRPASGIAPRSSVPGAKPAATPGPPVRTTAIPTPAPRPSAVPTKAVTPAPAPRPNVAPATVLASPLSNPTPVAPIEPPRPAAAPANSGEDLSGQMLGAYQLLRKQGEGRWGGIYAGVQTSINRPVALEILEAAKAVDPVAQARFVADARAKAAVQHPSILAVYEAGEADGRFFYAYEYVDGQSIAELKAAGQRLDEPAALKVLRVAADGLAYLNVHHTPHAPPDATSVFLGADQQPRLANLATQLADEQLTPPQEIQALGRVMLGVLPAIQTLSPGLREMLKRMVQPGPQALSSWAQLLQGIKAIEPKIIPTDAAKISAHDRAAIAAVELARRQQKRSLIYSLASTISLVVLAIVAIWYFFFYNKRRIFDEMVHIPAGEFLFANGERKTLPDFWIDKYEVTYGEYAEFVRALEVRPTTEFDHPLQPRTKNSTMHKPRYWEIYHGNAAAGGAAHSTPIDLSCPVMEVDFWDAHAYAKWKGRELPTEEEWEKAARGTKGFIYPWGEDLDPKKVNSNADFFPNDPGAKGKVDGFNFWNPVDQIKGDKSPFGVIGMAGNVREWTSTWDTAKKRPIVKGGSFMSSDVRLDQRTDIEASAISEALGFRTVSHAPPVKK